ncbi:hypothetical protein H6P81_011119 [Aristolochia fimbriata]|uniref:Uncharacterized protein n=1 Tax=Aristolochia fimbriata TaxID=158543 RepID=A0AAV7ERC2_ARIFI|nr:hypothetical protein H6P81_011119 [Aristolochia fimbriata]
MKRVAVDGVKVVGEWRLSPPAGSVPPTELRLGHFDLALLDGQFQYLLFFDFPGSTQELRDGHFPRLRRSLSLALSLFYPIAGRAVQSPESLNYPGGDHVIRCSDGDSASLALAESGADLTSLVGNQATKQQQGTTPLIAIQVTVFPGSGVSVWFVFNHIAADGFGFIHFLKSWAAINSKAAAVDVSVVKDLPVVDRAVLGDLERPHLS